MALFSDVHANRPAFQAVIEDARRRGVTEMVVLGDLIGDGPHPADVVALARKHDVTVLAGTFELAVARGARPPPSRRTANPAWAEAFEASAAWTARQLTARDLAWLKQRPPTRRVRYGTRHVLLAHGGPQGPWDAVEPGLPDARLADTVAATRADVLVTGRTHHAEVRALAGGRVYVNAGSVGRSGDGPEATYVLGDFDAGSFTVETVPYDVSVWERDNLKAEKSYLKVRDTSSHNPAESER